VNAQGGDPVQPEWPRGTVTFLFTDIEGSTLLLQSAPAAYPGLLERHRELVRTAMALHGGRVFGSEGDALFVAFGDASAAVRAAAAAQVALAAERWPDDHTIRVRMGIHTGDALFTGDDYVGLSLHQVARITAAGHGGQILISVATRTLLPATLPDGLELEDLGEHRLKDLARAENLFELIVPGLPRAFPPLRSLTNRPNNLPIQLTSFISRADTEDARRLLGSTRLLTLTGPGGTGKTRLALQLAADSIEAFPGGVYFVPLETIRDPDQIPGALVEALGLAPGKSPPLTRLIEHLRSRPCLLVLDNFEQVLAGASLVTELLEKVPDLRIIATSRAPLRTTGEQEFPVSPLELPDPAGAVGVDQVAGNAAVRLFVERAIAALPTFELTDDNAPAVVDIVRGVDGLPLAIELAAARVRILPVAALRQRLGDRLGILTGGARDRPARQQTLRGAIAWSHDLLAEPEQRLFRRLAVFAGGFCLSQVEAVCGGPGEDGLGLDGLASLVDESLVRSQPWDGEDPRFSMLPTIREYAAEQLDRAGERGAIERAHAQAFLALAEVAAPELTGRMGKSWLDRLELDHDNLRAAFDWAVAADDPGTADRLLIAIWRFWQIRGHLHEAERRSAAVLAMPGAATVDPLTRAHTLGAAGSIAYWRGDYPGIHRNYVDALEAARASGDPATIAEALYNVAFAASPTAPASTFELSRTHANEALALYRQLDDRRGIANADWALGLDAISHRDFQVGRSFVEESLAAYREVGNLFGAGWALHELAIIDAYTARPAEAEAAAQEALEIFAPAGDLSAAVILLLDLVFIARLRGQTERAWHLAGAADSIRKRTGADLVGVAGWLEWEVPSRPNDDPDGARTWDEGANLSADAAIAEALIRTSA
jgi:predicted ATPase/class 3 adenylate cyclase